LLSGPFHHQGLKFQCEPTEAGMKDFFDFEAWSLDAVASRQSKAVLPLLAGSPQAACILRPKQTPTGNWLSRMPPAQLELAVTVADGGHVAKLSWPFVPQFVAMDAEGVQLTPGEVCATLTSASPSSSVRVWTGGHLLEAFLEGTFPEKRPGNISVSVSADEISSSTVMITWNFPARGFSGSEELSLQLLSPVTGQSEFWRIKVDGSSQQEVRLEEVVKQPEVSTLERRWGLLGVLAVVFSSLAFCCCSSSRRRASPAASRGGEVGFRSGSRDLLRPLHDHSSPFKATRAAF